MSGDDYEFYNTDPIELKIVNLAQTGTDDVKLNTSGSVDNVTDPDPENHAPEDPIIFTGQSPSGSYAIYTTSPALSATVTVSNDDFPLFVTYAYDADTNKLLVTIR
jgi:hypothetical protein